MLCTRSHWLRVPFEERKKCMEQQLSNGIRLVDCRNSLYHSFCIGVYLRAGSMYEEEKRNGITHLFEHCVFRNIKSLYPDFYDLLSRNGLDFNARTYREFIQFEISGIPSGAQFALEILEGIFLPLRLSREDYTAEIGRIKAEIRENDEKTSVKKLLNDHIWQGTALTNPVTGSCGSLNRISRKQLEEYRRSIFFPGNILVCLTGNLPEDCMEALRQLLSRVPLSDPQPLRSNLAPVPSAFGKRPLEVHTGNSSWCAMALGFDIDNAKCPVGVRDLIYVTLFTGDNALFFQRLSEDNPLIYSYDAIMEQYRNISNVQVSFEINPKDIVHGLREIRLLLENLRQGQFSFEVNLQKQLTQWQLQLDYVCDFNWAVAYDNYLLGEAPVWADRPLLGRYEKVSREEIVRCTREIFRKPNMTLAIRGPKNKICTGEILRELELFPD